MLVRVFFGDAVQAGSYWFTMFLCKFAYERKLQHFVSTHIVCRNVGRVPTSRLKMKLVHPFLRLGGDTEGTNRYVLAQLGLVRVERRLEARCSSRAALSSACGAVSQVLSVDALSGVQNCNGELSRS